MAYVADIPPGSDLGNILVQAGHLHSWVNRSEQPCRSLVVVLTGRRD